MLLFCVKTIVKESHNFELAHQKKKKNILDVWRLSEEEEHTKWRQNSCKSTKPESRQMGKMLLFIIKTLEGD